MAINLYSKPAALGGLQSPGVLVLSGPRLASISRRRRSFGLRSCLDQAAPRTLRKSPEKPVWRCAPLLESELLPNGNDSAISEWRAVPDIWKTSSERFGDRIAVMDPCHESRSELTYKQLEQEILDFAGGLRDLGIQPDDKVALFADNSCRWLVADQGIMATGAINVVRGTRSSNEELLHIYEHSESIALVMEDPKFYTRLSGSLFSKVNVTFIILLWGDASTVQKIFHPLYNSEIPVYGYKDIINFGKTSHQALLDSCKEGKQCICETIKPDDVATLIYTSGTSGSPKGVMLSHQNLLHQIRNLWDPVPAEAGDRFLSILPPWHAYERAAEYFAFTRGTHQVYSNVKNLKADLKKYQPQFLVSVPLIYETLYSSIQKQISSSSAARKFVALTLIKISMLYMEAKRVYEGKFLTAKANKPPFVAVLVDWLLGRIIAAILWPLHNLGVKLVYQKIHSEIGISRAGISGGGSLPMHIDKFFEAIEVKVQNGYGLTETSPVISARRPYCNVLGTVGPPLNETELKVVDIETGTVLPDGSKGIVKIRGPQVMKGYYKNPTATKKALDEDGWFDTGDIGWIAPKNSMGRSRKCGGMLVLEGRAKDTIVLSTGENVEPSELEEAAIRSTLIQQIMVVGQDQRRLGALIFPNKDELLTVAKKLSVTSDDSIDLSQEKIKSLLYDEVRKWTSGCSFQIGPIQVVEEPFTIENGMMTPTMKIRRDKVSARYKEEIANLYK
ncbi:putative acyl-activating enzyme 16, chloroplastic [Iris pallida]|uniref:4-coumarate--CoA ligase n=1 Tax=Iris pallida TaxID=29817 RepID=A0AAX6FGZ7_IRIPA|nr:putative acyl-activating enzyme 16, chloroplastic [Iris pallida]